MPGRQKESQETVAASTESSPISRKRNLRMGRLRKVLNDNGPLYCRAVVPSYATRDFHNGAYAPWYVAHIDPNMVGDEVLAEYARDYARQYGYLFHSTEGLGPFTQFLEEQHGYVVLYTYHDGYCVLDGPEEEV